MMTEKKREISSNQSEERLTELVPTQITLEAVNRHTYSTVTSV